MANFTEHEKEIINCIGNERYKTTLASIRGAVEDLYSLIGDAPKIIKDYTDHGIAHCERLILQR